MLFDSARLLLGLPLLFERSHADTAYRRLALVLHPDKQGGDVQGFRLLKDARDICVGDAHPAIKRCDADDACKLLRGCLPAAGSGSVPLEGICGLLQ